MVKLHNTFSNNKTKLSQIYSASHVSLHNTFGMLIESYKILKSLIPPRFAPLVAMTMKSEKERFHVARSAPDRPAGTDLVHVELK